jgi:hypothetical protein
MPKLLQCPIVSSSLLTDYQQSYFILLIVLNDYIPIYHCRRLVDFCDENYQSSSFHFKLATTIKVGKPSTRNEINMKYYECYDC